MPKSPVTGVIAANNKTYDGTTTATLNSQTLTGVLPGDVGNVSLTVTQANFSTKNVGTGITVTATGLGLSGTSAGNYALTATTAAATANVAGKALTMSGLSVPGIKVYDGTTTAMVTGSPGSLQAAEGTGSGTTVDGTPYAGDAVSIMGTATGNYNSKDVVAAATVTFGGLSLTGAQSGNYTLTIQSPASATIIAKALRIAVSRRRRARYTTAQQGLQ